MNFLTLSRCHSPPWQTHASTQHAYTLTHGADTVYNHIHAQPTLLQVVPKQDSSHCGNRAHSHGVLFIVSCGPPSSLAGAVRQSLLGTRSIWAPDAPDGSSLRGLQRREDPIRRHGPKIEFKTDAEPPRTRSLVPGTLQCLMTVRVLACRGEPLPIDFCSVQRSITCRQRGSGFLPCHATCSAVNVVSRGVS